VSDLAALLSEADRLRAEITALRPLDAERERQVLQTFRIEWNYHSNAIEGNSLSIGETRAFLLQGLTARGKPFKDYLDIKGHDQAIEVLFDVVRRQEELTEATIRGLHEILLVEPYDLPADTPAGAPTSRRIELGRYKTQPNHVRTRTGATHYFASPEETPARMADLVKWYRSARDSQSLHPVILAAMFHHTFVDIHPFDDGNGRMARILTNLILMQAGFPPVVISTERKNEYFLALEQADAGDVDAFVSFVAESVIASSETYLRGLRGEPIDELSEFDKRLDLLSRSLLTQAQASSPTRTLESQAAVVREFVVPLLRAIAPRLTRLDPVFAQVDFSLGIHGETAIRTLPPSQFDSHLLAMAGASMLSRVNLHYLGHGFVRDANTDFVCSINALFHDAGWGVTAQLSGVKKHEIASGTYAVPFTSKTVEETATYILQMIYGVVEKLGT
jgi:Fic family protein